MEDNFYTPENRGFYDRTLYQPLNNETREIRLLNVPLAQQNQDRLEFKLEDKLPLSHFHDFYYAISYAAGDHTKTEVVQISTDDENSNFNAFSSLAKAVRTLRDHRDEAADAQSMSNAERAI